jgi:hypothetical protein
VVMHKMCFSLTLSEFLWNPGRIKFLKIFGVIVKLEFERIPLFNFFYALLGSIVFG